jgi:hypothetical protein
MNGASQITCSESCLAAGEPLEGTASDARFFAAVSWPKALWHHDKVALSEGLPKAIGDLDKRAKASGQKLQLRLFQRAGNAPADALEIVCADFAAGRTAHWRGIPAAAGADRVARFLAGEDTAAPLARPLLLVCTDGKHDLCCGKLGRSILAALRADGRIDAVEASHLGGHRLAANCLALPTGALYGRVGATDVPALAEAVEHGRVYLPRYRGRSGLEELAQVAEAAALGRLPAGSAIELDSLEIEADSARVAVGRIEIRCVRRTFAGLASCGDAEPEQRERWVLESVSEKEQ